MIRDGSILGLVFGDSLFTSLAVVVASNNGGRLVKVTLVIDDHVALLILVSDGTAGDVCRGKSTVRVSGTLLGLVRVDVPVSNVTKRTVGVEESVLVVGVRVRRVVDLEASKPSSTLNVLDRGHPSSGIHVELFDSSHVGSGSGGDTVLGHPDGLVETVVDGLDPLFELGHVMVATVPVNSDKVNGASELVALVHELLKPFSLVDHLGRANLNTLLGVRFELLHVKSGSVLGVEVGLARDLGFVEAEDVLGEVALHLLLALVPLRVILGTPEARNPLKLTVKLGVGTILPMPVPLDKTFCNTGTVVVVDTPGETTRKLGLGGGDGTQKGGKGGHQEL